MSAYIVRHLACYDSDTYDTRDRLARSVATVAAVTVIAGVNRMGCVAMGLVWERYASKVKAIICMGSSRRHQGLTACQIVGVDLLNDFGFGGVR